MTKRFCDRCGKEVGVFKDLEFQTWWTITRHGMMDLTTELCDDCYQAKFEADTPQTDCRTCKWAEVSWTSHYCDDCKAHNKYEPNDTPQTDCGWGEPK